MKSCGKRQNRYTGQMSSGFAVTCQEALQVLAALLVFGLCVLPPGYLLIRLLRWLRPQALEPLLWSVASGLPLAVAISVWGQRILPRAAVTGIFILLGIAAALLLGNQRRQSRKVFESPSGRLLVGLAIGFAAFCLVETVDVCLVHRIYLSTLINDWSVRVAMVEGAMRSGVPAINDLSTLSVTGPGKAPPLRYYYFWYVLVAQVAATVHCGARPALIASCIWAGWAFFAAMFLVLHRAFGQQAKWTRACVAFTGLLLVLGLDILPTAVMWTSRRFHPLMEMEWWRADRTPSFLGMVLASPHHIAALCSLFVGTLLLFSLDSSDQGPSSAGTVERSLVSIFAGVLFATASGLALFPTFCFAIALSCWAVDLIRRKHWATLASLAGSGVFALVLAHGYLTELSTGSSAARGFANFAWRSNSFAAAELARYLPRLPNEGVLALLARQVVVLLLDLFELGFYTAVLVAAVRRDLLRPGRLSAGRCLWWALLLGAGLPASFLSSTATSGPNDLGFDAGFLFRLCLQLWAAEWVLEFWRHRRAPRTTTQNIGWYATACLALLGLAGQLYQALSIRLYFPVLGSGLVHKQVDNLTNDALAERISNIREALRQFDRLVPPSRPDTEAVQFNPVGPLLAPEIYFNTHQVASWDTGCGTSFGGDYAHCRPIFLALLFLYGNTEAGVLRSRALNTAQDGAAEGVASLPDFDTVCRTLRLRAIVADATDSVWRQPTSWVWTGPVLVANSTVRIIGCPAGSWRP